MNISTPEHPPALLAAWAAHNGWPLEDARLETQRSDFHLFKAGYEARGAAIADALAGLRATLANNTKMDWLNGVQFSLKHLDATIAALGLPPAAAESEGR